MIGLGTYALRAVFFVMAGHRPPAAVTRLLPYVGPPVLAAITTPALVAPRGTVSVAATTPALLAAAAAYVAWRWGRNNLPVALFGGLALWWLASWALSTPWKEIAMDVQLRELGPGEFDVLDTVLAGLSSESRFTRFHSGGAPPTAGRARGARRCRRVQSHRLRGVQRRGAIGIARV